MSPEEIKHFLIVYDVAQGRTEVQELGTDYDAAVVAYGECEKRYSDRDDVDVVLLSADSLETVKKTHSSYFDRSEEGFERYFRSELAAHPR